MGPRHSPCVAQRHPLCLTNAQPSFPPSGGALDAAFVSPNVGRSALHVAARRGDSDVAKALVEAGWDVDEVDVGGSTPLHEAVSDLDETAKP